MHPLQQRLSGLHESKRYFISQLLNCVRSFELQYLLAGIDNFLLSVVLYMWIGGLDGDAKSVMKHVWLHLSNSCFRISFLNGGGCKVVIYGLLL